MTVSVSQAGLLVRARGTIAEVMSEISEQRLTNLIYWTDDNTNATAVCSRVKT